LKIRLKDVRNNMHNRKREVKAKATHDAKVMNRAEATNKTRSMSEAKAQHKGCSKDCGKG
jgi:hypothetical protein